MSRVAWCLAVLFAIGGCRVAAPTGETTDTAVWYGNWASDRHGFVNGQVSLRLPDPLPTEGQLLAPAVFECALLLISKGAPTSRSDLDVVVQEVADADAPAADGPQLRLTLATQGIFGVAEQQVVYEATMNRGDSVIEGRYTSTAPNDRGWFRLEREAEAQTDASAEPDALGR